MIYPNDANGDALRRMEAQGDDLTRPRDIDFSVAFADARSAQRFAAHFRALGYEVSAEPTETDQDFSWDVVVVQHMVPSYHGITKFENLLQSVASALGGHNDGWGCFSGNTSGVQNSEADIDEIIEGHEIRNETLRKTLLAKGIDLGEPRVIECHFWVWSEENAASLGEDLIRQGFEILVGGRADSVKDPKLWNVEAAIKQSIELTLRREFTDELVRTAARHLGKYDGWGTSL